MFFGYSCCLVLVVLCFAAFVFDFLADLVVL